MKKQLLSVTLAAAAATSLPAMASDIGNGLDLSMNAAITTDYVWRGISQTQGQAAIQGGIDLTHSSGVYAGIWASNVDFEGDATAEFDSYVGYGMEVADGVSIDVGYLVYDYTDAGSNNLDFSELYASVSAFGATVGVNYSMDAQIDGDGDGDNDSSTAVYTYVKYETEVEGYGISASIGHSDAKDAIFGNAKNYDDYAVSVSRSALGADWAITYTDTDLSSADCQAFAGRSEYCNETVAFSVSKSL